MLWRLPPIHFGKADGVERTLLRVACQSEPFLDPPWQGGASIRFLWHIGCQSDFDELVSMAFPSGGSWVWLDGKRLNVISSGEMRVLPDGVLAAKDTLRTDLSISDEMVPSTKPWMALPSGCIAARRRVRRHHFATRKTPLNTSCVLRCSTKGAT